MMETTLDTAAIIDREIRGEGAPAAPPAEPQPSAEEIAAAIDAAAAMMQEETGLDLPEGIPLPHLLWNTGLRKPVHAHKECGTDDVPCAVCKLRRERGPNGAVIDRYLKCVIYPGAETSRSAPKKAEPKVLTPTEVALEAVRAGADEVDPSVMDPDTVKKLLDMGRAILIGALEGKAKEESADKTKRAEALRAQAQRQYEEDCKRAELENAPYTQQIAELQTELAPLQERVDELRAQIEDIRSLMTVPEPPEDTSSKNGDKVKRTRTSHEGPSDQAYRVPTYQFAVEYNRRFPDARRTQRQITRVARSLGIGLRDHADVNADNMDRVFTAFMAEE